MGARGPQSQSEKLAPLPAVLPERPKPPDHFSEVDGDRWREIVNELPVDRFRSSDLRLLADLVTSERYARECDINIAEHGQLMGPGVQENPAVKLRERHMRIIVALQRTLRLPPSMRMRQDAGVLGAKSKPGPRPWETAK